VTPQQAMISTLPEATGFRAGPLRSVCRITLTVCLALIAGNVFALSFGDFVVREKRVFRSMTLYIGGGPDEMVISQVLIQPDDSGLVSHLYAGYRCGWPNVSPDLSWIMVFDSDHQTGSLVFFQRKNGSYQRVEEDFARRETDFEQLKGLIPRSDISSEDIGVRAEFAGPNRVLIRNFRRTKDLKEFNTQASYDFSSKTFSLPSAQETERISQADFGVNPEGQVEDTSPTPDPPVAPAEDSRRFLQHQSWGIRSPFDIDLFLSALNDQPAIDKMYKAHRIDILRLASEVTIVGEDPGHGMYQVRPIGKLETFYVSADIVGPTRPLGRESEIAQKHQLADDSSRRIEEFIEDLDKATGPNTLANTIQLNSQDVALALDHLKSVGIYFNDDLKKIEAAYKILKNAAYCPAIEVIAAPMHIAVGKAKLYNSLSKVYQNQGVTESQANATPQVRRAEIVDPDAPAVQTSEDNSFVNKVLHWISTHNGSSLVRYTVDEHVNYFGGKRMPNAFIEQDVNDSARVQHVSKPLEIAHAYLFDKQVLNTQNFTHEVSNEYSEHWVGPMLYDSLDVQTQKGWVRFTVGYTVAEDTTAIYALVLKIQ
jgi:hypothetical protein